MYSVGIRFHKTIDVYSRPDIRQVSCIYSVVLNSFGIGDAEGSRTDVRASQIRVQMSNGILGIFNTCSRNFSIWNFIFGAEKGNGC